MPNTNAVWLRGFVLAACALLIAGGLSGCGLFGSSEPPAKTYIVVPQQGTLGTPAKP